MQYQQTALSLCSSVSLLIAFTISTHRTNNGKHWAMSPTQRPYFIIIIVGPGNVHFVSIRQVSSDAATYAAARQVPALLYGVVGAAAAAVAAWRRCVQASWLDDYGND